MAATSPKFVRHAKLMSISLANLSEELEKELAHGICGRQSLRLSLRLSCRLIMGLWALYRKKATLTRAKAERCLRMLIRRRQLKARDIDLPKCRRRVTLDKRDDFGKGHQAPCIARTTNCLPPPKRRRRVTLETDKRDDFGKVTKPLEFAELPTACRRTTFRFLPLHRNKGSAEREGKRETGPQSVELTGDRCTERIDGTMDGAMLVMEIGLPLLDWVSKCGERSRSVAKSPIAATITLVAIELFSLPPNTTALAQPLDQGIIRSVKHLYRKKLATQNAARNGVRQGVLHRHARRNTPASLLVAAGGVHHSAELLHSSKVRGESEECADDCDSLLTEVLEHQGSAEALHFESFHDLDSDVAPSPELTDSEIVAAVVPHEAEDDENDDDNVEADPDPSPSLTAVADAVAVMRAFAEKKGLMAKLARSDEAPEMPPGLTVDVQTITLPEELPTVWPEQLEEEMIPFEASARDEAHPVLVPEEQALLDIVAPATNT
ncbi:hypothetical protein HPB50_028281 [Hyalomma asiaticum]|nr:hypothetical protein HPB50_028281 [Hyalomma asiaticum]